MTDATVSSWIVTYRNAQSHDCTINLIREVVDKGYNITQVRLSPPSSTLLSLQADSFPRVVLRRYSRTSSRLSIQTLGHFPYHLIHGLFESRRFVPDRFGGEYRSEDHEG